MGSDGKAGEQNKVIMLKSQGVMSLAFETMKNNSIFYNSLKANLSVPAFSGITSLGNGIFPKSKFRNQIF